MDSYQPIYDAVRSRIGGFDSDGLIDRIASQFDVSRAIDIITQEFTATAFAIGQPSVIFKPTLTIDGNQWCALYGKDLQNGVAGFGDTPAKAMADFDKQWDTFSAKGVVE